MPRWARSLQFKLTLGFTLILAGALLSVSAFTYATTERKIDAFSDEISVARGERLDHVVSESYNENDSWEGVQDAIVQVSRLYDWRIVIEDEGGLIVGDSHSAFDRNPLVSSFFFRRPVVVGGVQMGNFFIETGDGFVAPPGDRSSFIRELERQQNKLSVDDDDHDDDDDGALRRPAGNKTAPAPPVELATEPQLSELASSFNRSYTGLEVLVLHNTAI